MPVPGADMSLSASARSVPGTLRTDVLVDGRFHLVTDEPAVVGGDGSAPAPHELFPAALASCVATTLVMYARTKAGTSARSRSTSTTTTARLRVASRSRSGSAATSPRSSYAGWRRWPLRVPSGEAVETGIVFEERILATVAV